MGLLVVLPTWVCGSIVGGVAGVGVGLMVALPAWVWLGLYFGGFCGAGIGVDEIVGKKNNNNNCFYNILIEYYVK